MATNRSKTPARQPIIRSVRDLGAKPSSVPPPDRVVNEAQSCVDRRLERLNDCTSELTMTVEELHKRLGRVMLPTVPVDAGGDAPAPEMTELSQQIDRQADIVLGATRYLQSILQRLGL